MFVESLRTGLEFREIRGEEASRKVKGKGTVAKLKEMGKIELERKR